MSHSHRSTQLVFALSVLTTVLQTPMSKAAPAVVPPPGTPSLPTGMRVNSGSATPSVDGQHLNLVTSPNAVLEWQNFSIGAGYSVNVQQASAQSQVLNRVTGQNPSYILGSLTSNGKVWLLNPNGVLFGQNARVDVGSLVASTLNLSDADFASGRYQLMSDPNAALNGLGIVNQGQISTAYGGQILLIAPEIDNSGNLDAPGGQAALLASHWVELVDTGLPYLSFKVPLADGVATTSGNIQAQQVDVYGGVVNQQGVVRANGLSINERGEIVLAATQALNVEGRVDASQADGVGGDIHLRGGAIRLLDGAVVEASGLLGGGRILTEGAFSDGHYANSLLIDAGSQLRADALSIGDGGHIELWSENDTRVLGAVIARGGAQGGNGGFIETSSHGILRVGQAPNASAPNGIGGTWLIDPYNLTISNSGSPQNTIENPSGVFTSTGDDAVLSTFGITDALSSGTNVTIATGAGGTQAGDITVASDIVVGGDVLAVGTLTLSAHGSIFINANIRSDRDFYAPDTPNTFNLTLLPSLGAIGGQNTLASNASIDLDGGTLNLGQSTLNLGGASSISNATLIGSNGQGLVVLSTSTLEPNRYASFNNVKLGSASLPSSGVIVTVDVGNTLRVQSDLEFNGSTLLLATRAPSGDGGSLLFNGVGAQHISGNGLIKGGNFGPVGSDDNSLPTTASIAASNPPTNSLYIDAGISLEQTRNNLSIGGLAGNAGHLFATGGSISINQGVPAGFNFSNSGLIEANFGTQIELFGDWVNLGTLYADQGTIRFRSAFSTSDIGTVQRDVASGNTPAIGRFEVGPGGEWINLSGTYDLAAPGHIGSVAFTGTALSPSKLSGGGTLFSSSPGAGLQIDASATAIFDGIELSGLRLSMDTGSTLNLNKSNLPLTDIRFTDVVVQGPGSGNASILLGPGQNPTFDNVSLGAGVTTTVPGSSTLTVLRNLTLDGILRLNFENANLLFAVDSGPTDLNNLLGSGQLVSNSNGTATSLSAEGPTGLSIGSGIDVYATNSHLVIENLASNAGSITTDGGWISINQSSARTWSNTSTALIKVQGIGSDAVFDESGFIDLYGNLSNAGTLESGPSGVLSFYGAWNNTGMLRAAGGTVSFHSAFTTANIGNAQASSVSVPNPLDLDNPYLFSGIFEVADNGAWDNSAGTYDLSAANHLGSVRFVYRGVGSIPTLTGGTLNSATVPGDAVLDIFSEDDSDSLGPTALFTGVTLGAGLTTTVHSNVRLGIHNGLTLTGTTAQNAAVLELSTGYYDVIDSNGGDDDIIEQAGAALIFDNNLGTNDAPLPNLSGTGTVRTYSENSTLTPGGAYLGTDNDARLYIGQGIIVDVLNDSLSINSLLRNAGRLVATGGELEASGVPIIGATPWINTGSIEARNGHSVEINDIGENRGSLLATGADSNIQVSGAPEDSWTNATTGIIEAHGGSIQLYDISSNDGLIKATTIDPYTPDAIGGLVEFPIAGSFSNAASGKMSVQNGSTIHATGGFTNFGLIGGDGEIDVLVVPVPANGALVNSGTIAPGALDDAGGSDIGTLTITGNYTQTSSGKLVIQAASNSNEPIITIASLSPTATGYDVLNVSGTANLAGSVLLNLVNGYEPETTDVLTVLLYGNYLGSFGNLTVTPSVTGTPVQTYLDTQYQISGLSLPEAPPPPPRPPRPPRPPKPPVEPPPVEPPPVDPPPVDPPPVDPPPVDPPPIDPPPVDPPPVDPPPVDPPPTQVPNDGQVEQQVILGTNKTPPLNSDNDLGSNLVVDASHRSDFDNLVKDATSEGNVGIKDPGRFLLTDGNITVFRNVDVAGLNKEQIKALLDSRQSFKANVFGDALLALEQNPELADFPYCTTLQEAETGRCILTEDLQKLAKAKKRAAQQNKTKIDAAIPSIARKRALVIGLNDYRDSRIPQLTSALPDARSIRDELSTRLGYEVTTLENPSRTEIARWLNRMALEMNESDSLVIYFAGHGELVDKTGLGYWIPADADAKDPRGWISNADVSRWLGMMQSKQVALIIDSCYSGTFASQDSLASETAEQDTDATRYLDKRSVAVMTSGSDEPVADTGNNGHSVFAWNLLQQLRSLDKWEPGSNVFIAVRDQVESLLPQSPQYGAAIKAGHQQGGDFLFERRSLAK